MQRTGRYDYIVDKLDDELEAATKTATTLDNDGKVSQEEPQKKTTLPDKFKDKSVEEIAASYTELEKAHGRQSTELGELRKLADGFIKQQLETTKSPSPEKLEIEEEDFLRYPTQSVDKMVGSHPKLRELEDRLARQELSLRVGEFRTRHPDYLEISRDPAFTNWLAESPYRAKMFERADQQYDLEAADELMSLWKDKRGVASGQENLNEAKEELVKRQEKREEALKKASTIKSSTGESGAKMYRRADIIKLKIEDPERYSMLQPEIMKAYQEGRVR